MSTNAELERAIQAVREGKYDIELASVECLTHGPNSHVWSEARGYYCCWWCLKERGLV